jgi:hypothetical protein
MRPFKLRVNTLPNSSRFIRIHAQCRRLAQSLERVSIGTRVYCAPTGYVIGRNWPVEGRSGFPNVYGRFRPSYPAGPARHHSGSSVI